MQNATHNVAHVFDELKTHYELGTYRELAAFLDVKEGTLNAWKARNRIGDVDAILKKCEGLNYEWLKTGKGEMFKARDNKEVITPHPNTIEPWPEDAYRFSTGIPEQATSRKAEESKSFKDVFSIDRDIVRLLNYFITSRGISSLRVAKTLRLGYSDLKKMLYGSEIPTFYVKDRIIELLIHKKVLAEDGTIAEPEALIALEMLPGQVTSLMPNDSREEYVRVPRHEIAATNNDDAIIRSVQIVDSLAFKAEWLHHSLGLSPDNIAVIAVADDSMEPYLVKDDLIIVDLGVTSIEGNSVYVLQYGGSLFVRRVQVKLDGEVTVKSDNPHYEIETYRGESVEHLRVVGQLVRRLVR